MLTSGNTFACVNPGFWNSSNDNTRPTTDWVFPFGAGGDWLSFDVGVLEIVGEAVVVGASVFVDELVAVTAVGADSVVADTSAVGALFITVGAGAELTAGVVADVVAVFTGDVGLTGDTGLVGLSNAFLQLFDVVTQGCHTGLP